MRVPQDLHPIERALAERLPHLRPLQRRGLALWVLGAVLAQSACQSAVLAALLVHSGGQSTRWQRANPVPGGLTGRRPQPREEPRAEIGRQGQSSPDRAPG